VPNSAGTKCIGPDWTKHPRANGFVDVSPTRRAERHSKLHLASVSWVIPGGLASDHAAITDGSGPSWVASIVNAIGNNTNCDVTNGQSGYWYDTAILITWDDWGGWYDHVPPPPLPAAAPPEAASYEYGFRVPLMVVSAYTPLGMIDNTVHGLRKRSPLRRRCLRRSRNHPSRNLRGFLRQRRSQRFLPVQPTQSTHLSDNQSSAQGRLLHQRQTPAEPPDED